MNDVIVLLTTKLSVTDANVCDTLLAISVVFSDDIGLNLNEKIFKKIKKKLLQSGWAGQDGRSDADKQTIFWGPYIDFVSAILAKFSFQLI